MLIHSYHISIIFLIQISSSISTYQSWKLITTQPSDHYFKDYLLLNYIFKSLLHWKRALINITNINVTLNYSNKHTKGINNNLNHKCTHSPIMHVTITVFGRQRILHNFYMYILITRRWLVGTCTCMWIVLKKTLNFTILIKIVNSSTV